MRRKLREHPRRGVNEERANQGEVFKDGEHLMGNIDKTPCRNSRKWGNGRECAENHEKKDFEAFFARIHAWRAVNPCIMRWRLNSSDLLISNKP